MDIEIVAVAAIYLFSTFNSTAMPRTKYIGPCAMHIQVTNVHRSRVIKQKNHKKHTCILKRNSDQTDASVDVWTDAGRSRRNPTHPQIPTKSDLRRMHPRTLNTYHRRANHPLYTSADASADDVRGRISRRVEQASARGCCVCEDTLTLHAHASGDGGGAPGRCCRLCGGDRSLRHFGDTYVWEGVEERYDRQLYECFGVKVSQSDCMICERCVRQLRNTERFRALVHAAFDRSQSHSSSNYSPTVVAKKSFFDLQYNKYMESKPIVPDSNQEVIGMSKTKLIINNLQRRRENIRDKRHNVAKVQFERRKVIVSCTVCKQRYQMLMPNEGLKNFVCSRCKKNRETKTSICRKCNFVVPSNMMQEHLDMHSKANLRKNNRNCNLSKKSQQAKQVQSLMKTGAVKNNLSGDSRQKAAAPCLRATLNCVCAVCGKNLKTRELLDKHVFRLHTTKPIYQCDVCPASMFKCKRDLQIHALRHKHMKFKSVVS